MRIAEHVVNKRTGIVEGVVASRQQEMMLACRSPEIPRPTFRFHDTHHINNVAFNSSSTGRVRLPWQTFGCASLAFCVLSNTTRLLEAFSTDHA